MCAEFHATEELSDELCNQVSSLEPLNPFRTFAYSRAMRELGAKPTLLYCSERGRITGGCSGFVRSGHINTSMEIPSSPPAGTDETFWIGLLNLCRKQRVSELFVESFGSESVRIPSLPGQMSRRKRVEHVLDLQKTPLSIATNHRRNIQKAEKAGVTIERTSAVEACLQHALLQDASMQRRIALGEKVSADAQTRTPAAFLRNNAGELFRAVQADQVLSSILILRSARGAYYHSAGTSAEGMALGASHFLISRVIEVLRRENIELFNLGGADASNPGLERFKKGFGSREVLLESASFSLSSPLRRKLISAVRSLRDDPVGLLKDLAGRAEDYRVYSCRPEDIAPPALPAGVEFRKISDAELLDVADKYGEMRIQREKYEQLSVNDAYGVFVDGVLAQVSWLIPAAHDRMSKERNVKLKNGEAEITHAVTLAKYRNRGLYAHAIQCLIGVCRTQAIGRVYMITSGDNLPSQKGIEKAGLRPAGRLWRLRYRHLGGRSFAIRGHRLRWLLPV
jgi:Acetyltransferase (GNAT) domain